MVRFLSSFVRRFSHATLGGTLLGVVISTMGVAQGATPASEEEKRAATPSAEVSAKPDGDILVTPIASLETVLIAPDGSEKHVWRSEYQAASGARLLPDGSILRIAAIPPQPTFRKPGVRGGRVQRIAWDGKVLWDFWNAATLHMVCGDALLMPNGNVLMSVIEHRSKDECIAMGMDPAKVTKWGMYAPGLMEFIPRGDKGGRLVWRWSLWDHMSQNRADTLPNFDGKGEQRGRFSVQELPETGFSCAELDYDEASKLILMTLPATGEVWLLDRSTTLLEARTDAGGSRKNGGAILWRWRASPQEKEMNPSRVMSAAIVPGSGNHTVPKIQLLAYRGMEQKKTVVRVETLIPTLPLEQGVISIAAESPEIVARWSELSPVQGGLPNALLGSSDCSWGLSRGGRGVVEWHGSEWSVKAVWRYTNGRGALKRPLEVMLPGKTDETAKGKQPAAAATVEAGIIGRPKFYSSTYLKHAP